MFLLYVDTHVLMDIKGGHAFVLNVIYHPLYSMNNFVTSCQSRHKMGHKCVLIWGDWLSCDPLRGSHEPGLFLTFYI